MKMRRAHFATKRMTSERGVYFDASPRDGRDGEFWPASIAKRHDIDIFAASIPLSRGDWATQPCAACSGAGAKKQIGRTPFDMMRIKALIAARGVSRVL